MMIAGGSSKRDGCGLSTPGCDERSLSESCCSGVGEREGGGVEEGLDISEKSFPSRIVIAPFSSSVR
jgi:hypothetical protein